MVLADGEAWPARQSKEVAQESNVLTRTPWKIRIDMTIFWNIKCYEILPILLIMFSGLVFRFSGNFLDGGNSFFSSLTTAGSNWAGWLVLCRPLPRLLPNAYNLRQKYFSHFQNTALISADRGWWARRCHIGFNVRGAGWSRSFLCWSKSSASSTASCSSNRLHILVCSLERKNGKKMSIHLIAFFNSEC